MTEEPPKDHTGESDCPACARIQSLFEAIGVHSQGMNSNDIAYVMALSIHTILGQAPSQEAAESFVADLNRYAEILSESGQLSERCH